MFEVFLVVLAVFEILLVVLAVVVAAVVLLLLVVVVDLLLLVIVVVVMFLLLVFATCTYSRLQAKCFYLLICCECVLFLFLHGFCSPCAPARNACISENQFRACLCAVHQ